MHGHNTAAASRYVIEFKSERRFRDHLDHLALSNNELSITTVFLAMRCFSSLKNKLEPGLRGTTLIKGHAIPPYLYIHRCQLPYFERLPVFEAYNIAKKHEESIILTKIMNESR